MKITKIKTNENKKLTKVELEGLAIRLESALKSVGYITNAFVVNSSRIDLSYHRKSFVVDTQKLGYNASYNPYSSYKLGYKRTSLPTWDQRVDYNEIVNYVLNKCEVSANVKSGPYTIREGLKNFKESDWYDQKPEYQIDSENRGFRIERITA